MNRRKVNLSGWQRVACIRLQGLLWRIPLIFGQRGSLYDQYRMTRKLSSVLITFAIPVVTHLAFIALKSFVSSLLVIGTTYATEDVPLRVVTENYPPLAYQENGEIKGVAVDIVRDALAQIGSDAKIEILPWSSAYNLALHRPNTLLFATGKTPEREPLFHWIALLVMTETHLFKNRDGDPVLIRKIEDLKYYRIGGINKDMSAQWLEKHAGINVFKTDNYDQLVRMLFANRVDLIPMEKVSIEYYSKKLKIPASKFQSVYQINELTTNLYCVMSKKSDEILMKKLIKEFNAIHR